MRKLYDTGPRPEIAKRLGVPVYKVGGAVHRLVKAGEIESLAKKGLKPRTLKLMDQVRKLRAEGLGNVAVVKKLCQQGEPVTLPQVEYVAQLLIRMEGESLRKRRSAEEIRKFDQEVERLMKEEHLSGSKIAERLNCPYYLVVNSFSRLRRKNEIEQH